MKRIKLLIVALMSTTLLTGCFKRDVMENANIVTTTYPLEYIIASLYSDNSNISSLYPNGVNPDNYDLTNKKIKDYSDNDILIYNGATNEKNIAASLLNKNDDLKLIDVAKGISIQRDEEELWLCPANYLMLAQNIKNGLEEYITSNILIQEIDNNYDTLKFSISEYDAELKMIASNANNSAIIAGNDVFKFLEKYGFTVYSVEDNDLFESSDYTNAKTGIENKTLTYIFLLEDDKDNGDENVQKIIDAGATPVYIENFKTRTEDEALEDYTYTNMLDDFLEKLKEEVYN